MKTQKKTTKMKKEEEAKWGEIWKIQTKKPSKKRVQKNRKTHQREEMNLQRGDKK